MKIIILLFLTVLGLSQVASGAGKIAPVCLTRCSDFSKYVAVSCMDSVPCLCANEEYQTAMYQCLHSQCEASQLGPALHKALSQCYEYEKNSQSSFSTPALLRRSIPADQDGVAKRQAVASAVHSGYTRRAAGASVRPKRSVRRLWTQARGSRLVKPTPVFVATSTPSVVTTSQFVPATPTPAPAAIDEYMTNDQEQHVSTVDEFAYDSYPKPTGASTTISSIVPFGSQAPME